MRRIREMDVALPKLRGDLQISPASTGHSGAVVIKDPLTQRYFRFGEMEYLVARQLDGATPVDVVQQTVGIRGRHALGAGAVERLVAQLRRLNLLEESAPADTRTPTGRVRGSVLYLRLKAF